MGLDIMFRCSAAHYSLSSSPSLLVPSPPPSTKTMESAYDALGTKPTLTPQRKHHKLLKDGSEVWSEDVEKIFVEGLRKYWESPWATYSRGRSRWRNQFLVDHLKKYGIDRSKKQVASHIQVLRNMWRGEPEFHLVAGGEELFHENGLLAPTTPKRKKSADRQDRAERPRLDSQDSYSSSSSASTPDFAALEFPAELSSPTSSQFTSPPSIPFPDVSLDDPSTASLLSLPDTAFATITPSVRSRAKSAGVKLEPLSMDPTLFTLPQAPFPDISEFSYIPQTCPQPNRICSISLWTEGMHQSVFNIDQLTSASLLTSTSSQPPPPFRVLLRVNVRILHTGLANTPVTPGLRGTVSFAAPWMAMAKCHTKTWSGKTCVEHDVGYFDQLQSAQTNQFGYVFDQDASQPIVACLPDSPLSRCSWLDTVRTITQQIVVDSEVLAVIIYNLEHTADTSRAPSVELVGFHKYPWRMSAAQGFPSPPISPSASFPTSFEGPLSPPLPQPMMARSFSSVEDSLSCALSYNRGSAPYDASASNMHPGNLF
ncbi:hypothetical protein OBBRIDRAFT_830796 [Obba rivulosa]|uniref:TEA domain-containing protein n=1 Tax=Obba rivulosa TaxID=1052685 RepID=A0A8E2J6A1_9APHY|nr:hypothetical protein OBBRIDRAFT_830796 [Obba rivulosa]